MGTFLADPTEVPEGAVRYVAARLAIEDPMSVLPGYVEREPTHREHASEVRQARGYEPFGSRRLLFRPTRYLYGRAWGSPRSARAYSSTWPHLLAFGAPRPPAGKADARLHERLARLPDADQRQRSELLLLVEPDARRTKPDRLGMAPTG